MARDFEDMHDLHDLSDDEIRELVVSRLADHPGIDEQDIEVTVEDGVVHLQGRVGTEQERRVASRVLTDELGIEQTENELLVDPIRRAESPEAVDDHLADAEATEGLLLGDRPLPVEPEAEHLHDSSGEDVRAFGSTDVKRVIADAEPWIPPQRPTPEGLAGMDAEPPDLGEDH